MTNSEYARKFYTDRLLAMYFVQENTDSFGKKVYYGHFDGTTTNILEAIDKEENWLQQEAKEEN